MSARHSCWRTFCLFAVLSVAAAQVEAACLVSAGSMAFGSYDVFSTSSSDSTAAVQVECDADTPVQVVIDRGGSPTFDRYMARGWWGGDVLYYNLYLDAAMTAVWGDGTGGTTFFTGTVFAGTTESVPIYGTIPPGQDVSAGTYFDMVTVTVNF